jgi:arsenate reductase
MCVANSARSQLAEGLCRDLAPDDWRVYSAGSEPSVVRPQAIEVMRELGLDLGTHRSKGTDAVPVHDIDVVITLCADEVCPVVLADVQRLHWPIPDPAGHDDESVEQQLQRFRVARDDLRARLVAWLGDV